MKSGTVHILLKLAVVALMIVYMMMGAEAEPRTLHQKKGAAFNVLLITVDCLRPDHMSNYGYHRNTTPHIDRFFKNAFRFEKAYSQSAWTSPGVVSLLTGMNPSVHGMTLRGNMTDPESEMPLKELQDAGWRTLTYTRDDNYANLGWDETIPKGKLIETLKVMGDRPFFAWYHFRDTHLPYNAPEPFRSRYHRTYPEMSPDAYKRLTTRQMVPRGSVDLKPEDREQIRDMYDAVVAYQDDQLKKLFDYFIESGRANDTIVILTADHAEELMEHGWVGHASTSLHGNLYNETIHIPLLVRVPGSLKQKEPISEFVQQIDVLPTVFDLLSQPRWKDFQGRSLKSLMNGKQSGGSGPVFMETSPCGWQCPEDRKKERLFAVIDGNKKLIETRKSGKAQFELYDLNIDPGELKNRIDDEPQLVEHLKSLVEEYRARNFRQALRRAVRTARLNLSAFDAYFKDGDFASAAEGLSWVFKAEATLHKEFSGDPPLKQSDIFKNWQRMVGEARQKLNHLPEKYH